MINIEVEKLKGNFSKIRIEGHASSAYGERGKNILCAGISTLAQTLYIYLDSEGLSRESRMREGFLEIETKFRDTEKINNAFEVILSGIRTLYSQYPEEINLVENVY